MALGVLSVLTAIIALAVLDRRSRGGSALLNWRAPIAWLSRYRPGTHLANWRRVGLATWIADAAVIATLLLWHIIGATTSDDGYNLTIARVAPAPATSPTTTATSAPPTPLRLVSRGAVQARLGEHGRRLDATARHAGRHRLLADHQPLDAAPPGSRQGGLAANRVAVFTAARCSSRRGCRSTTGCGPNR